VFGCAGINTVTNRDLALMKMPKVALLWRGNETDRSTATVEASRLASVGAALTELSIGVEPAVYDHVHNTELRDQLAAVDAVLVWVNPKDEGLDRSDLDSLLRDVAGGGVMVSAHPDVIDAIGTKEVLYRTRDLSFGSDTRLYSSWSEIREQLPSCLAEGHARVLKPSRGNGGIGVWRVELADRNLRVAPDSDTLIIVRHAARGSMEEEIRLGEFLARLSPVFARGETVVDQIFQPGLVDGMIRCYLVGSKVAGFGEQLVNALYPSPKGRSPGDAPDPGPRLYYPPTRPDLQELRARLEQDWLPGLCAVVGLAPDELPVIWDADFLHRTATKAGEADYVLCEINVSSVFPFPDEALPPLAQETRRRLGIPA
jgi:Domain of unknown function (DUF6815)